MTDLGKVAYEAYYAHVGGKSAVTGAELPTWENQREDIRQGWHAAADAVLLEVTHE